MSPTTTRTMPMMPPMGSSNRFALAPRSTSLVTTAMSPSRLGRLRGLRGIVQGRVAFATRPCGTEEDYLPIKPLLVWPGGVDVRQDLVDRSRTVALDPRRKLGPFSTGTDCGRHEV